MSAFFQKILAFFFVMFHHASGTTGPTNNNPVPCGTTTACVVNTPEIDMSAAAGAIALITGMGMVLRSRRKA
jgi:hypothetical protein